MGVSCVSNWKSLINSLNIDPQIIFEVNSYECFVRAVTYKLNNKYYGSQEAEGIMKWDEDQGFVYVRQFIKAVDQYEIAREKKGVNIKEYFPTLIMEVIDK